MKEVVDRVNRLIEGFRTTALVAAAVRVGILDRLGDSPQSPGELAGELGLDSDALARLLRGLTLLDVVQEHRDPGERTSRFSIAPVGRLLRGSGGGDLASYARLSQGQYVPAWMSMESALRGGGVPFQAAFGQTVWERRRERPEEGEIFDRWLEGRSAEVADTILRALSLHGTVADVGGGRGVFLSRALTRFPECRGVLAEQGQVLTRAREYLETCGLLDRCDLVPTDFFTAVPERCDAYLLKSVLHDWGDQDCERILGALHRCMPSGSRLHVIERILPVLAGEDPQTIWVDLHMMTVTGGRERTREEYEILFDRAGLPLETCLPTGSPFAVMTARKGS